MRGAAQPNGADLDDVGRELAGHCNEAAARRLSQRLAQLRGKCHSTCFDDTSNFDDYDDDEDKFKEPFSGDQKQFIEFGRPYVIDTAKGPTR